MAKRKSKSGQDLKKALKSRRSATTKPAKGLDGQIVQQAVAPLPAGYAELIQDVKQRLKAAQIKAALAVNRELVELYWEIGGLIVQRQQGEVWGNAVLERPARDLAVEFPGVSGLSRANLFRMRSLFSRIRKDLQLSHKLCDN